MRRGMQQTTCTLGARESRHWNIQARKTSVPRHIRQSICHDLSHEFSKHSCFQNKENYTAENLKKLHLDEKTVWPPVRSVRQKAGMPRWNSPATRHACFSPVVMSLGSGGHEKYGCRISDARVVLPCDYWGTTRRFWQVVKATLLSPGQSKLRNTKGYLLKKKKNAKWRSTTVFLFERSASFACPSMRQFNF